MLLNLQCSYQKKSGRVTHPAGLANCLPRGHSPPEKEKKREIKFNHASCENAKRTDTQVVLIMADMILLVGYHIHQDGYDTMVTSNITGRKSDLYTEGDKVLLLE